MIRKVKIGLMQTKLDYSMGVEDCQQHMLELTERCLSEGADLVFMPELYQYKTRDVEFSELVKKYAAPYKEKCAELARKHHAYVVPWDLELDEQGRLYNTSYILNRTGEEIGRYRKVQLTWGETDHGLARGNKFHVFDLDFGKVGIMICFDNYFPESARALGINGAELILYPLYGDLWAPQWEIRTKARAIDSTAYVATSIIGGVHDTAYTGMIDPYGEVICRLDEQGSCQVIEIELGKQMLNPRPIMGHRLIVKNYWAKSRNVEAYRDLLKPPPKFKREEYIYKEEE